MIAGARCCFCSLWPLSRLDNGLARKQETNRPASRQRNQYCLGLQHGKHIMHRQGCSANTLAFACGNKAKQNYGSPHIITKAPRTLSEASRLATRN